MVPAKPSSQPPHGEVTAVASLLLAAAGGLTRSAAASFVAAAVRRRTLGGMSEERRDPQGKAAGEVTTHAIVVRAINGSLAFLPLVPFLPAVVNE